MTIEWIYFWVTICSNSVATAAFHIFPSYHDDWTSFQCAFCQYQVPCAYYHGKSSYSDSDQGHSPGTLDPRMGPEQYLSHLSCFCPEASTTGVTFLRRLGHLKINQHLSMDVPILLALLSLMPSMFFWNPIPISILTNCSGFWQFIMTFLYPSPHSSTILSELGSLVNFSTLLQWNVMNSDGLHILQELPTPSTSQGQDLSSSL